MVCDGLFGWMVTGGAPSLPRVVAIIAEALAVEVLPPDHAARTRLVGIVKQIQVTHPSISSTLSSPPHLLALSPSPSSPSPPLSM